MLGNFCLVMLGGAIGASLRYAVSIFGPSLWGESFPWATLVVNGIGCLAIGVFLAFGSNKNFESTHLLLVVGVLGALTTFSTFSAESIQLVMDGYHASALANIAANLVVSLSGCTAGVLIGRLFTTIPV